MPDDLFAAAATTHLERTAPLAARLRPRSLDDLVGQQHLLGPGRPLRALIEADRLSSLILWGPAGTGKTTMARVIASTTSKAFEELSAVHATVRDVREVLARAEARLGERQQGTILFLDEVHRFNRAQQDALLPGVESGLLILIGATTENPFFEVNPPLLSRSTLFRLERLDDEALEDLVCRGAAAEGVDVAAGAIDHLVRDAAGDGRHVLTTLEVAAALASVGGRTAVTVADAEAASSARSLGYGRDDHYDVVSALIKSIRGSDVDASLYWLARMLDAGEDPRFIARRLLILASEDVGMADPTSLVVVQAAAAALDRVGLPEAALHLAQAVIHLSVAPKSNRVTVALGRARDAVRRGASPEVPSHLRDSHHRGAAQLGHGAGYRYPHDDPSGWVAQQHRPAAHEGEVYYEPSSHGVEATLEPRRPLSGGSAGDPSEPDR